MADQDGGGSERIRKLLGHLDVSHHSLRHVGQELALQASDSPHSSSSALYERSLVLSKDCSTVIRELCNHLHSEDLVPCQSALSRIERAIDRASQAGTDTPHIVNTWRVVEVVEQFLGIVAESYRYVTLSEQTALEGIEVTEREDTELARLLERRREVVAPRLAIPAKPLAVPSLGDMPRWRVRQFFRPGLILGIAIVFSFAIVAVAAPLIAPPEGEDPYVVPREGYVFQPQPPTADHPLGTMERQYDVFYGLVWGTRVAFKIGLLVTLGRAVIGVLVGLISGYYGGLLDAAIMRLTDAFMAFPIVPATLLMLVFFGPRLGAMAGGVDRIVALALIVFGWMQYARLVRGNVLAERAKQYVEAAIAIGARTPRIIFRHVLPNVPQGLFVLVASDIGAMVVLATVFTFLGLSGYRGLADWGMMLNIARNWIIGTPSNAFTYWYCYLPPSVAIVLFSMGWNLIGDSLRDVLDPRLR
jgi:peptide/nickel transport system permease protein